MSSLKYIMEQPSSVMLYLQENSTLTDTKPKLDTENDIVHEKSATLNSHTKASTPEVHSSSATKEKSSLKDSQSKPTISSAGLSSHALVSTACLEEEKMNTMTIEEIIELGDGCLGLRIILTSREASYMGVINYVLPACRQLALEKVCNPKTGKKRLGMLTVFFHNILNISVVGDDKEARQRLLKDVYSEAKNGRQLLVKKCSPMSWQALDERYLSNKVDDDVLLGRTEQKSFPLHENTSYIQEQPPPPAGVPRPAKWVVIDTLDDAFKKALTFIRAENVIAMGMEGLKLGRSGTLAWLSVATSTMIFLFDMANMGASQAFQEGLGDIIQDSAILKIVHDCRAMEDILHHQFQINFSNIFDTQAADVYLFMNNHPGTVPSFVSSLPSLLIRHLKLSPHHVFFPHVRQECSQDDESVWFERPLSPHLCEGMSRNIKFLRELRSVLLDLIMVDLAQVTNLYQGSLRDKDSTTANRLERHIVPEEVQRLGCRSINNRVGDYDPYIYYYKNSFKLATKKK